MANLKEYDLVLYYTGRDNIYLGRIISITPVVSKDIFASWVDIQSIRMLCGSEKYNIS